MKSLRVPVRRSAVIVALAAASIGVVVAAPGTASAADVACVGSTTFTDKIPGTPRGLEYTFKCSEDLKGYTIFSNKQLAYFSTEVIATDDAGNGGGGLASCEGSVPGYGFGCSAGTSSSAKITNNYNLTGLTATLGAPCSRTGPDVHLWVAVTIQQFNASGAPYTNVSQPFRLKGPDCTTRPKGSTHHGRR